MDNYYKTLGLPSDASQDDIKMSYRKLSKRFHPDVNKGDAFFENMFKYLQEAYDVLSDIEKRKAYDQSIGVNNNYGVYGKPEILYFEANKYRFYSGDKILFKWEVANAEVVEIKPFGKVQAKGEKTFKINNYNKEELLVQLYAANLKSNEHVSKRISLRNQLFVDIREDYIKYFNSHERQKIYDELRKEITQHNKTHSNSNHHSYSSKTESHQETHKREIDFWSIAFIILLAITALGIIIHNFMSID